MVVAGGAAETMTDEAPQRRRVKPPGPFGVVAASSGLFFGLVGALAIQERLAAPRPVAVAAAPPREIVKRKVVLTRIVVHERRRGGAPRATTSAPPARTSPAPAAPAAPAPAPLTTRTS